MAQPKRMPPPVVFGLGLFFGLLIGVFVTFLLTQEDGEAAAPAPDSAHVHAEAGPVPSGRPGGRSPQPPAGHAAPDRAEISFAKVHFMKKFVAALTKPPANKLPNPAYEPLLKDPSNPLRCADCHDPRQLDIERMKSQDPGAEAVEPYRRQPRFMIPLMMKWVKRLNEKHGARLRKPVTCTDCHAIDPREANRALPPLMINFVNALKQRPKNKNPATGWKPLLKDPNTKSMLCGICHGDVGKMMERNLDRIGGTRMQKITENKAVMITLMEHWVTKLNRRARHLLVKAVACIDCHETDPRK